MKDIVSKLREAMTTLQPSFAVGNIYDLTLYHLLEEAKDTILELRSQLNQPASNIKKVKLNP